MAPVVAVLGVNPVVPAENDVTPPVLAAHVAVVPFEVSTYPFAPMARRVALFVPLPMIKSPVVVTGDSALNAADAVVCPVPPLPMGNVPVTPVVSGSPVALVRMPDVGVPSAGVTKVGDVANTSAPDPVSSVTTAAKLALVGVPKKVATPAPRPETPVDMGRPDTLVSVPDAGVPNAPPLTTKAPPEPTLTASAVATFVPNPDIPVATGSPVAFVNVTEVGVPKIGVTSVGDVAKTLLPVPVLARFPSTPALL